MRTRWKVLLVIVAALAVLRAALPSIVKSRINAGLARVEGWDAAVADVDLAVLRGGLVLRGIEADGKGTSIRLSVDEAAVDVGWGALLRRRLVASVDIRRPKASLTVKRADTERAKDSARKAEEEAAVVWPNLKDISPFRIDRFAVRDGEILVKEGELEAKVSGLYFVVESLTNIPKDGKAALAEGAAGASLAKGGTLRLDFRVDPSARPPAFDFTLAVKKIDLPSLNPLLRAQFGLDVEKGVFELVSEAESSGGGFRGYVKPFIEGLEMGSAGGKGGGAAKSVKEAIVGAVGRLLENRKTDAVAAKVPFEGRYDDPEIGVWEAFVSVLRNAFVKALTPTFEGVRR
ncbi:MAG: DUF748 domain-containing protein [Elusimicrobia bacterium]|nr:DUF748 domain-containing protein [Elusimicrobiota bacterium]